MRTREGERSGTTRAISESLPRCSWYSITSASSELVTLFSRVLRRLGSSLSAKVEQREHTEWMCAEISIRARAKAVESLSVPFSKGWFFRWALELNWKVNSDCSVCSRSRALAALRSPTQLWLRKLICSSQMSEKIG